MNEEKIIDYLKEIIQEIEYRHKDGELILVNDTTTDKLYYSIKGLLDLYNKEIQRNKDLEQIEKEHKEENGRLRNRIKELEGIYTTAYNMGKAYVNIKWKEKIIKKAKEYKETKQKVGEYMAIALEELLKESDK